MKDRQPSNPGRVLITPEDGSSPFYATVTRADEPTEAGTPLNKATLLTDETAALFGLGVDATVNDVFASLPWEILKSKPSTFERLLTGRMI